MFLAAALHLASAWTVTTFVDIPYKVLETLLVDGADADSMSCVRQVYPDCTSVCVAASVFNFLSMIVALLDLVWRSRLMHAHTRFRDRQLRRSLKVLCGHGAGDDPRRHGLAVRRPVLPPPRLVPA